MPDNANAKDTIRKGEPGQMDFTLWIAQIFLAIIYGMTGLKKIFKTEDLRTKALWAKDESAGCLRLAGASELIGAAGIILPLLTDILLWLVPLAAMGLALIQFFAIFTVHLPRNDYNILPLNFVLLTLSIFVAVGRWNLIILSFPFL